MRDGQAGALASRAGGSLSSSRWVGEGADLARRRQAARDSVALVVGTAANGLFAYAFFALVTQKLGADRAAPIAVLWTYWGACTAVVTFPLQHWIIRTLRASGEGTVRNAVGRLFAVICALAVLAAGATWTVRDQLFLRNDAVFPVLIALLTIVMLFGGVVRGGLAGRDRFVATAVVLGGENLLRLVLAAVVLTLGGGAAPVGAALVAGGLLGLAWPSSYRFDRDREAGGTSVFSFLGAVASGSLIAQVVLVGGPAVLALIGGAPREVTALFVTLALFRAPYLLALGLANQVTGALTDLVLSRKSAVLRRFVTVTVVSTSLGSAVAGWAARHVGPPLIGLIFGPDTAPPSVVAAVVAAGSVVAVGNLALALLVIAQGVPGRLTWAWFAGVVALAFLLTISSSPPIERISWAFLCGELVAFVILTGATWRDHVPVAEGRHAEPAS